MCCCFSVTFCFLHAAFDFSMTSIAFILMTTFLEKRHHAWCFILKMSSSGVSCSNLTMSLMNDSLKFQMTILQLHLSSSKRRCIFFFGLSILPQRQNTDGKEKYFQKSLEETDAFISTSKGKYVYPLYLLQILIKLVVCLETHLLFITKTCPCNIQRYLKM